MTQIQPSDIATTIPLVIGAAPATVAPTTARVLHVINGEHYSGAERVQDLLARELPGFGFEIGFACVKPHRFPDARNSKSTPLYELPMRWAFDPGCVANLAELIHNEEYAIVHAHTPRSLLMGSLAARQARVPLVYHVHSPTARDSTRRLQNFVNAKLEHWALNRAERLIAVSPSLKQLMCSHGFGEEQVVYVPNGVPPIEVAPRSSTPQSWTMGMAALFRPRKGVEILIEALASLRSQGYDVHFRAVGPFESPEYQQEILQLVGRLGVQDAITWTGFVEDIAAELSQIDLFVLPSLFGEGLPMVVLESMAAGVPVVASHVEGIPEAIRHREDGLLFEPGSVSQLVLAIEQLMDGSDGIDYVAMSRNAQERHRNQFSANSMAGEVAGVYRQILS